MPKIMVNRHIVSEDLPYFFDQAFFVGISNLCYMFFCDGIGEKYIKLSEHLLFDMLTYEVDVLFFRPHYVHSLHKWELAFEIVNHFGIKHLLTDNEGKRVRGTY